MVQTSHRTVYLGIESPHLIYIFHRPPSYARRALRAGHPKVGQDERRQDAVMCLPAHSTHLLQPLDVGVFSGLSREHKRQKEEFQRRNPYTLLKKENFCQIFSPAFQKAVNPAAILGGFRHAGLIPLQRAGVLQRCGPSEPLKRAPQTPEELADSLADMDDSVLGRGPAAAAATAADGQAGARQRRRFLSTTKGAVLTADDVIEGLQQAQNTREEGERRKALRQKEREAKQAEKRAREQEEEEERAHLRAPLPTYEMPSPAEAEAARQRRMLQLRQKRAQRQEGAVAPAAEG